MIFHAPPPRQVLAEDLRNRGGTKDYSTLAVKLGVAEAEIRSLTARKMQLAVKLSHVEREREQALQVCWNATVLPLYAKGAAVYFGMSWCL